MEAGSVATTANCIYLDASTPCGSQFSGMPILSQYFPTVADFTSSISNFIGEPDHVADSFVRYSGCNPTLVRDEIINTLRYQTSVWCSSVTHDAIVAGCRPQAAASNPYMLCSTECHIASTTLNNVLGNENICPRSSADEEQLNRVVTLDKIRGFCELAQNSSTASTCFSGLSLESQFCGWRDARTAVSQCNSGSMSNDTCCQRVLSNPAINTTTSQNSTSINTNNSSSIPRSTTNNNPVGQNDTSEYIPHWTSVNDTKSTNNNKTDAGKDKGGSSYSTYPQVGAAALSIPVWIPVFFTVMIIFSAIPLALYAYRYFANATIDMHDHEWGHEHHPTGNDSSFEDKTKTDQK